MKRDDFESAARRNPQLAKELEMLGAMRPVIGDVLALRESVEPARVAVVEQTAGLMGRSVSGRKLMRLLGWKGLRPMGDILKKSYENALNEATGGSRRAGSGKLEQFVVQPEKGDGGEEK
ncbi:MAG: hypothetical protein P8J87_12990 [Verrucomicrobiales bacterium]|nr:hypothetical protein [Verrucomicrobiales bacterium]